MSKKIKLLSALSIGGVMIASAAGLMVVNADAQSPTATALDSKSSAFKATASPSSSRYYPNKKANFEAVKIALDNADYEAWKVAIQKTPKGDQILSKVDTLEKFNRLAEAHKAVKEAKEKRQTVISELGLDDTLGQRGGPGIPSGYYDK